MERLRVGGLCEAGYLRDVCCGCKLFGGMKETVGTGGITSRRIFMARKKRYKVGLYSFNEKEAKRNIEARRLRCG